MSHLILPCEWQTARSAASIAITDHFAAAGVGAFGRTCWLMSPSPHEARAEDHPGPWSCLATFCVFRFDDRRETLRDDRVQSLHSKDWLTQALRHVHLT